MSLLKLSQAQLDAWVSALVGKGDVFGPQAKGERFAFDALTHASRLRLDHDVTILPPKKYFLPPTEHLLRFSERRWESVLAGDPFVLFGVHPYDVVAIAQMDRIFADGEPDVRYLARREGATIVACDVQTPSENCFASCMGTAVVKDGFDVLLTRVGEDYVADARTEKGEALLDLVPEKTPADRAALLGRLGVWQQNRARLSAHKLNVAPEDLPELLEHHHDHPVWEERSALCFSCGSCNLVCPTCYCFNVKEEVDWDLRSGTRKRTWDACALEGFAAVAGGHNFRAERTGRFRHRYLRKGKYIPDKIGEVACVGCGRCISACVANIANPVEVFNRLSEESSCPAPVVRSTTSTSRN